MRVLAVLCPYEVSSDKSCCVWAPILWFGSVDPQLLVSNIGHSTYNLERCEVNAFWIWVDGFSFGNKIHINFRRMHEYIKGHQPIGYHFIEILYASIEKIGNYTWVNWTSLIYVVGKEGIGKPDVSFYMQRRACSAFARLRRGFRSTGATRTVCVRNCPTAYAFC